MKTKKDKKDVKNIQNVKKIIEGTVIQASKALGIDLEDKESGYVPSVPVKDLKPSTNEEVTLILDQPAKKHRGRPRKNPVESKEVKVETTPDIKVGGISAKELTDNLQSLVNAANDVEKRTKKKKTEITEKTVPKVTDKELEKWLGILGSYKFKELYISGEIYLTAKQLQRVVNYRGSVSHYDIYHELPLNLDVFIRYFDVYEVVKVIRDEEKDNKKNK